MKYYYFVSFLCKHFAGEPNYRPGSSEWAYDKEITNIEMIREFEAMMEKEIQLYSVFVVSYQFLRKEESIRDSSKFLMIGS